MWVQSIGKNLNYREDPTFHDFPELDWPPVFDIYTADMLSKQALYTDPYESIGVTHDGYGFGAMDGAGMDWEVSYDGSVGPVTRQQPASSNPVSMS